MCDRVDQLLLFHSHFSPHWEDEIATARSDSTQQPRRLSLSRHFVAFEWKLRRLHVDERSQFINIGVTVGRKIDVRRDVQGSGGEFRWESPVANEKIVVAVDQYLPVPARNDFCQLCGSEIGQAQVHRATQMPQFELSSAARIEDYHASLRHRLQELIFGEPPRFPDGLDLLRVVQK